MDRLGGEETMGGEGGRTISDYGRDRREELAGARFRVAVVFAFNRQSVLEGVGRAHSRVPACLAIKI